MFWCLMLTMLFFECCPIWPFRYAYWRCRAMAHEFRFTRICWTSCCCCLRLFWLTSNDMNRSWWTYFFRIRSVRTSSSSRETSGMYTSAYYFHLCFEYEYEDRQIVNIRFQNKEKNETICKCHVGFIDEFHK